MSLLLYSIMRNLCSVKDSVTITNTLTSLEQLNLALRFVKLIILVSAVRDSLNINGSVFSFSVGRIEGS